MRLTLTRTLTLLALATTTLPALADSTPKTAPPVKNPATGQVVQIGKYISDVSLGMDGSIKFSLFTKGRSGPLQACRKDPAKYLYEFRDCKAPGDAKACNRLANMLVQAKIGDEPVQVDVPSDVLTCHARGLML